MNSQMVGRFPNYKSYEGFYDLRCYEIPARIFKKLWHIQDVFFEMNKNKKYYKKWHSAQWQEAQELSADYQRILFQFRELVMVRRSRNEL